MKDEVKFKEYMTALGELHDKKISPLLLELYWKALNAFADGDCERAFKELIFSARFFPKPADFIEILQGKKQDQGTLKWLEVVETIKRVGPYESVKFSDPVIHSVIEAMGGWIRLGDMLEDEEKWKAKEFERLYLIIAARPGKHPEYLPGICDRDNAANGYDVKTKPVQIGFEKSAPQLVA